MASSAPAHAACISAREPGVEKSRVKGLVGDGRRPRGFGIWGFSASDLVASGFAVLRVQGGEMLGIRARVPV